MGARRIAHLPSIFATLTLQDLNAPMPYLDGNVIRLHAFSLDVPREVRARCALWLSRDEQVRAARFRFDQDHDHFVVAHGYLRCVLGAYCGRPPGSLVFRRNPLGKPELTGVPPLPTRVRFSLTHSHGRALLAVAREFEVGVDLEQVRTEIDYRALAVRFFAPSESKNIVAHGEEEARRAFFRHWVGKEAVLKARGTGLYVPPRQCELQFTGTDMAFAHCQGEDGSPEKYCVKFIALEPGWVGAVAAAGTDWRVVLCG
jgi:4'-phosphopantetheinyl transferase